MNRKGHFRPLVSWKDQYTDHNSIRKHRVFISKLSVISFPHPLLFSSINPQYLSLSFMFRSITLLCPLVLLYDSSFSLSLLFAPLAGSLFSVTSSFFLAFNCLLTLVSHTLLVKTYLFKMDFETSYLQLILISIHFEGASETFFSQPFVPFAR